MGGWRGRGEGENGWQEPQSEGLGVAVAIQGAAAEASTPSTQSVCSALSLPALHPPVPAAHPSQPACLPASRPAAPGLQYTFILHASKELPKAVTNVDKGKSKKRQEVGVRLPDDPGAEQAGQRGRGGAGEEGRVLDCLACLPMDGLRCGLVKVAVVVAASTSTVAPAGRQGQQR